MFISFNMGGMGDLELRKNDFSIILPQRRGHGPNSNKIVFEGRDGKFFPNPQYFENRRADFPQTSELVGLKELSLGFRRKFGEDSNFGGRGAQSGQKWHSWTGVGHFERGPGILGRANFTFS